MVLHRMSWRSEQALFYEWDMQIGADNSLVFDHELVFVIRPDELFGQIERVDFIPWHGGIIEGDEDFSSADVISTRRGLVVTAVTAVQRAFRKKRYLKWYGETVWDTFVEDVKFWLSLKCRYFRKSTPDPFCDSVMPTAGPTWGYVPAPAVAACRSLIVPALGRRRRATTSGSVIVLDGR